MCLDQCSVRAYVAGAVHLVNYEEDGHCDDGGEGSDYSACPLGTDCADCLGRNLDRCEYECYDGGTAAGAASLCATEISVNAHDIHIGTSEGVSGCFLSQWNIGDSDASNLGYNYLPFHIVTDVFSQPMQQCYPLIGINNFFCAGSVASGTDLQGGGSVRRRLCPCHFAVPSPPPAASPAPAPPPSYPYYFSLIGADLCGPGGQAVNLSPTGTLDLNICDAAATYALRQLGLAPKLPRINTNSPGETCGEGLDGNFGNVLPGCSVRFYDGSYQVFAINTVSPHQSNPNGCDRGGFRIVCETHDPPPAPSAPPPSAPGEVPPPSPPAIPSPPMTPPAPPHRCGADSFVSFYGGEHAYLTRNQAEAKCHQYYKTLYFDDTIDRGFLATSRDLGENSVLHAAMTTASSGSNWLGWIAGGAVDHGKVWNTGGWAWGDYMDEDGQWHGLRGGGSEANRQRLNSVTFVGSSFWDASEVFYSGLNPSNRDKHCMGMEQLFGLWVSYDCDHTNLLGYTCMLECEWPPVANLLAPGTCTDHTGAPCTVTATTRSTCGCPTPLPNQISSTSLSTDLNVQEYAGISTHTCTPDELLYYENGLDAHKYALLQILDPNRDGDLSDCQTDTSAGTGSTFRKYVQVTHPLPVQSDAGLSAIFGTVTGADGLPYLTVQPSNGVGPACVAMYDSNLQEAAIAKMLHENVDPPYAAYIATDGSPVTVSCTS